MSSSSAPLLTASASRAEIAAAYGDSFERFKQRRLDLREEHRTANKNSHSEDGSTKGAAADGLPGWPGKEWDLLYRAFKTHVQGKRKTKAKQEGKAGGGDKADEIQYASAWPKYCESVVKNAAQSGNQARPFHPTSPSSSSTTSLSPASLRRQIAILQQQLHRAEESTQTQLSSSPPSPTAGGDDQERMQSSMIDEDVLTSLVPSPHIASIDESRHEVISLSPLARLDGSDPTAVSAIGGADLDELTASDAAGAERKRPRMEQPAESTSSIEVLDERDHRASSSLPSPPSSSHSITQERKPRGRPKLYCICRPYKGDPGLFACDNNKDEDEEPELNKCLHKMAHGYFHAKCMGLPAKPDGSWLCPKCEKAVSRAGRIHSGRKKKAM